MTTVSVIVPVRNEAGTIKSLVDRMPVMGSDTEIVFVSGQNTDNTDDEIIKYLYSHPLVVRLICQRTTTGKADAVRRGFDAAKGEVLMILDGDLSIAPEDLPKFLSKVQPGVLVNATRFEIEHEKGAMWFLNVLGNKFFAIVLSWITGQPMTDSLAGTKVLMRSDWLRMKALPKWNDPFLDHTLLFNAALLGMKIIEVPVAYKARVYGRTNISRFRHGWVLLRMSCVAFWRIKVCGHKTNRS